MNRLLYLPLGSEHWRRNICLSQRAGLWLTCQGIEGRLVQTVDIALTVDKNRVITSEGDTGSNLKPLSYGGLIAVPVGQQNGSRDVGGGLDGLQLGRVRRDQTERSRLETVGANRQSTKETIVDLRPEVRVVPV